MFLISNDYWEIRETKNKGKGIFAKRKIAKGRLIGDYVGELVHLKDIDFDKERQNMYLMHHRGMYGVYPDLDKPGVHLINHSCSPNCWITSLHGHTIFFAMRTIKKDEEITISYLLPPAKNCIDCSHKCFCGSISCTGTFHLSEDKYKIWQSFQRRHKEKFKTMSSKNELRPFPNYPKLISQRYLNEINNADFFHFDLKSS